MLVSRKCFWKLYENDRGVAVFLAEKKASKRETEERAVRERESEGERKKNKSKKQTQLKTFFFSSFSKQKKSKKEQ